jgi:S1-C subfamily serine protease
VTRAAFAAVCVPAVLATALAWPASRDPRPPFARVLTVAVTPPSGPAAVGSGFTAGPGRVVTVAHLVENGARIEVRGPGRPPQRARLLRRSERTDLALLAVPGLRAPPLRTANAGDDVRLLLLRDEQAVTRPARVRRDIMAHVRAAPGARPHSRPALELGARITAGDSGAPVVGAGGEVTGVLFARSRMHAGTAYAVEASAMEELIRLPGRGRP